MKNFLKKKHLVILIALFIAFGTFFSAYSIIKHNNYNSYALDLGDYAQTVWKYSQFNSNLENTVLNVKNLLGDHFEVILIPLGLIYKAFPDPITLLIVQAFALTSTIFPLYLLIYERTKTKKLSILMCVSFLMFYGTQAAIDFDFHPIVFAVPFLVWALLFFERKKYIPTTLFLLAALLCKESVPFYIIFFGIYGLFSKKNKIVSALYIFGGIGSFFLITKFIMPFFLGKDYRYFQFTTFGNSPVEAGINMIKDPLKVIKTFFNNDSKKASLLIIFGSTAGFSLLGGLSLIIIAPMMFERFLGAVVAV